MCSSTNFTCGRYVSTALVLHIWHSRHNTAVLLPWPHQKTLAMTSELGLGLGLKACQSWRGAASQFQIHARFATNTGHQQHRYCLDHAATLQSVLVFSPNEDHETLDEGTCLEGSGDVISMFFQPIPQVDHY